MTRLASAAAAATLAACAPVTPLWKLEVAAAGRPLDLAAREPACEIEFQRTRTPQRAYDEFATLHYQGEGGLLDAQEAIRAKACALGADAVLVTGEFASGSMWNTMSATAVSYPELRERHRADAAARAEAEAKARAVHDAALARARAELPGRAAGPAASGRTPPPGLEPARLRRGAILRERPDREAKFRGFLEAGTDVWIDPRPERWRRAWTLRGQSGWLEDPEVDPLLSQVK